MVGHLIANYFVALVVMAERGRAEGGLRNRYSSDDIRWMMT